MPHLAEFLLLGDVVPEHRPWPRTVLEAAAWSEACARLAAGRWSLLGLWAEPEAVHMALFEEETGTTGVASLRPRDGHYPSVGQFHAPAIRLERAVRDLVGLVPDGLPDDRPWLDHGRWPLHRPLADAAPRTGGPQAAPAYPFLTAEGEGLHQVPVGPVHAGIIEPGHFRFTANGETVVRLEERLGYTHKGVERLMAGADTRRGNLLAGRVCGDSTVAWQWAFSRAVEAALGVDVPPRALWLRALMAELERLANHLGDFGAICNDAAFALMNAHCAILREQVLRVADACFGHRFMRDGVVPGGVARDLDSAGEAALRALLARISDRLPALVEVYDNTASLQDRTNGAGITAPDLVRKFAAGGHVGRAAGRMFDARRTPGYAPYDALRFEIAHRVAGDVNARIWVRIDEAQQSLGLIGQILDTLPQGPLLADLPRPGASCEGVALVESFRGDVLAWLRLDAQGRIVRCHLRDPSWFQWPLLEAAIEGNIIADFPLCNKSFNCAYSGHDL